MRRIFAVIICASTFLICAGQIRAVTYVSTISAELNVSAKVKPRPGDLTIGFTSDLTTNTVGADTEIEYTITYGSLLDYGTPMVIEAEWSMGTIPDRQLYAYNVVSYVPGSATRDYWGESTPVVDTVHRKITWTVTRFPPNTVGKTLRFKLKTPGVYLTDRNVAFSVTARMRTDDTALTPITLDQIYTPGDFIRRELKGLHLLSADLRRVTDSSFTLFIVTNIPTRTVVYYGLTPETLEQFSDTTLSDQKLITIEGLHPATTYYYRILIENDKGIQRKTPEVFTVTTASKSLVSLIDQDRVLISSRGVLLKSGSGLGQGSMVLVPTGVPVELYLPFLISFPADIHVTLSPAGVLGLSTDERAVYPAQKIRLLETQFRTYTGSFTAPLAPGMYDVFLEADVSGSVNQDIITTLMVTDPITVATVDGHPIEHAMVYLERYDAAKNNYEYFPAQSFGTRNPAYTDSDGTVDMVLPDGQYMVNVNAIGYRTYQSNFTFSPITRQGYPRVGLEKAPFSILTYAAYYGQIIRDSWSFFHYSVDKLASSFRFLDLSLIVSLTILTLLSLFLNLRRIKLSLEGLVILSEKHLRRILVHQRPSTLFIGFAENSASGMPVHHATVFLVSRADRTILSRDLTDELGEFRLKVIPGHDYDLIFKKSGFTGAKYSLNAGVLGEVHPPFPLKPETVIALPPAISFAAEMLRILLHAVSDTLLWGVGILNLLLFVRLGIRILPLWIITAINAFLWLSYHWGQWKRRLG